MKIIIVGAGRTGCALIETLTGKSGIDITVIEKQKSKVDAITDKYNVNGVAGSGASKDTLRAAGADTADYVFALTPIDEINLLSCMQARTVGARHTVARVFQPDFHTEGNAFTSEQGIDYIFNPKYDMAREVMLSIGLPGVVRPVGVFANRIQMISLRIAEGSPLAGKILNDVRRDLNVRLVITTVLRDGRLYVPDGTFRLEAGDSIGVASDIDDLMKNLRTLGIAKSPAKRIMVMGGDITAEYLIGMLTGKKKSVTVIEKDLGRCRELMDRYPSVNVVLGEGELTEVLEDEKIKEADVVVSLTESDEDNLVTSMYAWSKNVPSIITRIDSPAHLKLLHRVNLDITLSTAEISVLRLIRYICNCEAGDAPNEIEEYYTVADNKAEVLQFTVGEGFRHPGVKLGDQSLRLRKGIAIASIIHEGELVIPDGSSCINKGDKVIIVTDKKNHIENLNEIFP